MTDENSHSEFYANAVNVMTSVYDVTLNFRTQSPVSVDPETGEAVIEVTRTTNIRMSPQHAKSLAVLLVNHIAEYERKNGVTLPIPSNLQELWEGYVPSAEGDE